MIYRLITIEDRPVIEAILTWDEIADDPNRGREWGQAIVVEAADPDHPRDPSLVLDYGIVLIRSYINPDLPIDCQLRIPSVVDERPNAHLGDSITMRAPSIIEYCAIQRITQKQYDDPDTYIGKAHHRDIAISDVLDDSIPVDVKQAARAVGVMTFRMKSKVKHVSNNAALDAGATDRPAPILCLVFLISFIAVYWQVFT